MSGRDRALATELVYGSLRQRGRLDWLLAQFVKKGLDSLNPSILDILRLGAYQLVFLDRVASFAAVNEAVEAAKVHGGSRVAGFVNGVLRNVDRRGRDMEPPGGDSPEELAAALSHPAWLVRRFLAAHGAEETRLRLAANNAPAPAVLRVNTERTSRERLMESLIAGGALCEAGRYSPHAVVLKKSAPAPLLPEVIAGEAFIQDEASQLVPLLLEPSPENKILDMCAAPGGKSAGISLLMKGRGRLTACDKNSGRLAAADALFKRLGLANLTTLVCQADRLPEPLGRFDRVLLDAPCSALGALRSNPDARWNREEEIIGRMAKAQAALLDAAAARTLPGGRIVYSTCSTEAEENEQVVKAFLEKHREFSLGDAGEFIPETARELTDREGFFRTETHRHGTDGFFAAILAKSEK